MFARGQTTAVAAYVESMSPPVCSSLGAYGSHEETATESTSRRKILAFSRLPKDTQGSRSHGARSNCVIPSKVLG